MSARRWALAALACAAAACATGGQGQPIDPEKLGALEEGVTTREQVRQLFGDPTEFAVAADGGETWTYRYLSSVHHSKDSWGLCPLLRPATFVPILGWAFENPFYCTPAKTQEELTVVFDASGVVAKQSFDTEEVVLDDPGLQRGRMERRPRAPGPIERADGARVAHVGS